MIVPLFRRSGGDSDFFRPGTAAGDEFACPSQSFEGLMPWAGARFCANFRGFPWGLHNRNGELVNPRRHVTGTGDPPHVGLSRERGEERPPDR